MIDSLVSTLSEWIPAGAASVVAPALEGAGLGALGSLATKGNPLVGGLIGGIGGAGIGAFGGEGGYLAQTLGLGTGGADALIGGTVGGLGALAAGGNPLMGAGLGALAGYGYGNYGAGYNSPDVWSDPKGPAITAGGWEDAGAGAGGGAGAAGAGAGAQADTAAKVAAGGGGRGIFGGGGINKTTLALGALAALGSMFNKPQQGQWPLPGASQNPNIGPTWNQPLNTNAPGRTATNPWPAGSGPSYWAYGGPEATYFAGNSLKNYGFAEGGEVPPAGALDTAAQDGEFSTANGQHYVEGPGDGMSDDVPAKLSTGEYVLTAQEVSLLGRGDNQAGAKKLDQFRDDLKKKAGVKKFLPASTGGALNSLAEAA